MDKERIYPSLEGGRLLPLVESFYTIQGEGFHTGKPAYFIRLGGCDVGCRWCDSKESWNPDRFPPVEIEEIVRQAAATPAKAIVITGGEPMNYPLDMLCNMLKDYGLEIFLETSGSSPMSGKFDWICLSPKRNKPPRDEFFAVADELKVIVETPEDFQWAEENRRKVLEAQRCQCPSGDCSANCSSGDSSAEGLSNDCSVEGLSRDCSVEGLSRDCSAEGLLKRKCLFFLQPEWSRMKQIAPAIVEYVKAHPEWNVSVQAHKFLRIP